MVRNESADFDNDDVGLNRKSVESSSIDCSLCQVNPLRNGRNRGFGKFSRFDKLSDRGQDQ